MNMVQEERSYSHIFAYVETQIKGKMGSAVKRSDIYRRFWKRRSRKRWVAQLEDRIFIED